MTKMFSFNPKDLDVPNAIFSILKRLIFLPSFATSNWINF